MKHKHPKYWFWTVVSGLQYVPYKLMGLIARITRRMSLYMAVKRGKLLSNRATYFSWNIEYRKRDAK